MKISVVIPTIKDVKEVTVMIEQMQEKAFHKLEILVIAKQQSVAKNQNEGLDKTTGEYVVICGDDVEQFPQDWDKGLVEAMETTKASMVMPRLLNPNGNVQALNHGNFALSPDYVQVSTIPSAVCMFGTTLLRFDENFKGGGFEDTDFCKRLGGSFYVANTVKMVHRNEKKNQFNEYNRNYFNQKWGKK